MWFLFWKENLLKWTQWSTRSVERYKNKTRFFLFKFCFFLDMYSFFKQIKISICVNYLHHFCLTAIFSSRFSFWSAVHLYENTFFFFFLFFFPFYIVINYHVYIMFKMIKGIKIKKIIVFPKKSANVSELFSRKNNKFTFVLFFVCFGLVSLFNGISTFVDYLMPKPSF